MRYAQVRSNDIANGPGIRITLFVTGCPFRCAGCFNAEYHDYNLGQEWNEVVQERFVGLGSVSFIDGFSILGGEPMAQDKDMLGLLRGIKAKSGKSVWMWTGFRFEDLEGLQLEFLSYVDVLVDGSFVESQYEPGLLFKGSKNQRLIDVKASVKEGCVVEVNNSMLGI